MPENELHNVGDKCLGDLFANAMSGSDSSPLDNGQHEAVARAVMSLVRGPWTGGEPRGAITAEIARRIIVQFQESKDA